MEVSGQLHSAAALTQRNNPRYLLNMRICGLKSRSGRYKQRKISCSYLESKRQATPSELSWLYHVSFVQGRFCRRPLKFFLHPQQPEVFWLPFAVLVDGIEESETLWGASQYRSFIGATFLYNLIHYGARTLFSSGLTTNYYFFFNFEFFRHFYRLNLQGHTSNTFPSSDWSDNERGLFYMAHQFKILGR